MLLAVLARHMDDISAVRGDDRLRGFAAARQPADLHRLQRSGSRLPGGIAEQIRVVQPGSSEGSGSKSRKDRDRRDGDALFMYSDLANDVFGARSWLVCDQLGSASCWFVS